MTTSQLNKREYSACAAIGARNCMRVADLGHRIARIGGLHHRVAPHKRLASLGRVAAALMTGTCQTVEMTLVSSASHSSSYSTLSSAHTQMIGSCGIMIGRFAAAQKRTSSPITAASSVVPTSVTNSMLPVCRMEAHMGWMAWMSWKQHEAAARCSYVAPKSKSRWCAECCSAR